MIEQNDVCMPQQTISCEDSSHRNNGACEPSHHTEMRTINIQPLNRGYILNVGCQSIAVSSKRDLKILLRDYIDNPYQVEQDYYAGKILPKN